jgi:hypothetical protein
VLRAGAHAGKGDSFRKALRRHRRSLSSVPG